MSVHLKRIGSDKHLTQAFRFFDKDQNGFIEFEELREAMSNDDLGPNNEQVIRDIIFDVDLDKVIHNSQVLTFFESPTRSSYYNNLFFIRLTMVLSLFSSFFRMVGSVTMNSRQ